MSQELVRGRPIATQLAGLQLFPSEKRPRVIAMGLGTNESLARIAEAVKCGVTVVGIPSDKRSFKAHLTLGRIRGENSLSISGLPFEGKEKIKASEVLLYQNEFLPDGLLYSEIGRIKLSAGEG